MCCKRFQMPREILYQKDSLSKLGEKARGLGGKALIISDETINEMGYIDQATKYLKQYDIEQSVFLGVSSEPNDQYVEEAIQQYVDNECEMVISIGGGSCIDTAKAVAVIVTNGGYIGDYMLNRKVADKQPAPHIAIPTTAGTGSEATDVTVITSEKTSVKMMIKQPAFMPDIAIVDPTLTFSSPPHVTASTGVDALCHAVEAYISKLAHPMSDIMALSSMELIVNNLEKAYENGKNLEARENMSLAALQAGAAFSNASVCLVHGMSRPIGAMFKVPHGFSNAMLLPAVLEISMESCTERLATLGRLFPDSGNNGSDEEMAQHAVDSVKRLCHNLNIPNFKEWGISKEEFINTTEKMAADAIESGSPKNNPKALSKEEIIELYEVSYDYSFS